MNNNFLYAIVDVETGVSDNTIHDIGAIRSDDVVFHHASKKCLLSFLENVEFVCGHNIVHHDAKYLFPDNTGKWKIVDTLYISPILFPRRPYHKLLKDDKLSSDQSNNPVNDCKKAKELLLDEIDKWQAMPPEQRHIFIQLLKNKPEFAGFIDMAGSEPTSDFDTAGLIKILYNGKICANTDLGTLISEYPCELAYALALIGTSDNHTVDDHSVIPGWVCHNYPRVERVMRILRNTACTDGCEYCATHLNVLSCLKSFFGYERFRTYDNEPLQQKAVEAAVKGKSLLAIFPTGGGKSLTFQLPALMAARSINGLTVVISPLQSLMKDQVDNLAEKEITGAVTINGLLDPISRSEAIKCVSNGDASLLYISPEMLRSPTISRILKARHIVRFVIDEAHCFSSWGQDFRVDYLYIGQFIKEYCTGKNLSEPMPVSCFTATAKQKVIQDIRDYFSKTLNLEMELFASHATRTNLRYTVLHTESDAEKYSILRRLVSENNCPVIVYVSRTKRTKELALKLTNDGYEARPFNGKMSADEKIANQNDFMSDKVRIIVATSAFGMGIDKQDVGLVVHYDISDSLENYIQEAGRAARDPEQDALCYVLFSDSDLDKHFILLKQTKLSISEIQQVWKAVKELTGKRTHIYCSALEIARQAGWDDLVPDIETRVRTALAVLEQSGYIRRGKNSPHVYATGITVKNIDEARQRISESALFERKEVNNAVRIMKSLISQKYISKAHNAEAESRIDYLADILGLTRRDVISAVERMRQEGILADSRDISAYLSGTGGSDKIARTRLENFAKLEQFILSIIPDGSWSTTYKQINDSALKSGITSSCEKHIRTLLHFLLTRHYISKNKFSVDHLSITRKNDAKILLNRFEKRIEISRIAVEWLYGKASEAYMPTEQNHHVQFSVIELFNHVKTNTTNIFSQIENLTIEDVEEALLYLSNIGVVKLEGGFLVLYNALEIQRLKDTKSRYKHEDYHILDAFYKHKIQQIHIVGEYANILVKDYNAAQQYVSDYFALAHTEFVAKYFKGDRMQEIQRNITPYRYDNLFGNLSKRQNEIISDNKSRCIVVAAGPGSGKTRVLVHKLASLILLEDARQEQLLMLTFSRAAATEFKQRLMGHVGDAAHYVDIKTFHSYCFDLIGQIGSLEDSENVVKKATDMIASGEVEPNRIAKTVLVIDEAQDMGEDEYNLVKALMERNEEMRVIAVGDDDQSIYGFRGSDSGYFMRLSNTKDCHLIEMTENYRGAHNPVAFANRFVGRLSNRMKQSPLKSMREEDGFVKVTRYQSSPMYIPLVEEVKANLCEGTTGILTQTNEEAMIVLALLKKYGVECKLIQSMDKFSFRKMAEINYFMRFLEENVQNQKIDDNTWENAKKETFVKYDGSTALGYVKRCVALFESTNRTKYISDFKEYVSESSLEDFCELSGTKVTVSTIHKAKGREFDDVFMLVADIIDSATKSDLIKRYYVGMTRAKNRLFIHTDSGIFDNMDPDMNVATQTSYPMPDRVILQLSPAEVILDFFKKIQHDVLELKSGDSLTFLNSNLYEFKNNRQVARLSKGMRDKLENWTQKGYHVKSAHVSFIVWWKPKDEDEIAIVLPEMVLERN